MSEYDLEQRLAAVEAKLARQAGSVFRPITSFTAGNPMFVRSKSFDHHDMKDRTRSLFVSIFDATIRTNTPAITVSGTNTRYRAWAFDSAQTEEILCEAYLPIDFQYRQPKVTPVLWHTNLGAGSGDVVWQVTVQAVNEVTGNINGDLNATGGETVIPSTIAAPVRGVLNRTVLSGTITVSQIANSRSLIRIGVARLGADVSDTLGNDAGLYGVELTYTADM